MLFGTRQIPKLVSARVFEHNGRQVEERIYKWTETHNKLIWAIYPVDRVVLEDGETCNPVCHKDYPSQLLTPDRLLAEKEARQAVQKAFDEYWDGPKGKQFKFTSKRKVKQEIAEEVSDRIENDKIVDLEETNG